MEVEAFALEVVRCLWTAIYSRMDSPPVRLVRGRSSHPKFEASSDQSCGESNMPTSMNMEPNFIPVTAY